MEDSIPYASIETVRLARAGEGTFKTTLVPAHHPPIVITNKYVLPSGESEDRSRQYATFVRVLHYHLKDKSPSIYTSGNNPMKLLIWSLLAGFISFLVSFISEYFGFSVVNPFAQAALMTAVLVVLIYLTNRGRLPQEYSPADIPLQFLP